MSLCDSIFFFSLFFIIIIVDVALLFALRNVFVRKSNNKQEYFLKIKYTWIVKRKKN